MLFIPSTVWEWFKWFQHNEKYPHVMPAYFDLPERYKGFELYYRNHVIEFGEMVKREGG